MRGVSDGGNANHSGPQPSVGTYVDEQPITTIGGTIDFQTYDWPASRSCRGRKALWLPALVPKRAH